MSDHMMSDHTGDMHKARRAHLSNEERQIEALEQIAEGIGGIHDELRELNRALKGRAPHGEADRTAPRE